MQDDVEASQNLSAVGIASWSTQSNIQIYPLSNAQDPGTRGMSEIKFH